MMRLILAAALLLSACSTPLAVGPQTFIDGYPVGEQVQADRRFVDFATATLDEVNPDHAPVSIVELYVPDYRMRDGQRYIMAATAGDTFVVVVRLVDDTVKAFLVGCLAVGYPDHCGLSEPPSAL